MKIYRFVPNTTDFGILSRPVNKRWWPRGIDLGREMNLLYADLPPVDQTAGKSVNYYVDPNGMRLSDFPALALNLPILSERAADVLRAAGMVTSIMPVSANDRRFYAVQSVDIPGSFSWPLSRGLTLADREIFYFYLRHFNENEIRRAAVGFFTIPGFSCSDLYLTGDMLDVCKSARLTGLEYLELVFDGEPCIHRYPTMEVKDLAKFTSRAQLERELIEWRCSSFNCLPNESKQAIVEAASSGYISFTDVGVVTGS